MYSANEQRYESNKVNKNFDINCFGFMVLLWKFFKSEWKVMTVNIISAVIPFHSGIKACLN